MSVGKISKLPFGLAFSRVSSGVVREMKNADKEKQIHASHSVRAPKTVPISSSMYSADGEELVYRNSGTGHGYGQGVKEHEVWMMLESARAKEFDESVKNVVSFKLDPEF